MSVSYTPMIEQYLSVKAQHTDAILFFRLGDFYEMFFADAETASKELELTLTSREGGKGVRVPMCGIPFHSSENYIARLVSRGYKVAICEQTEDASAAKGLVKREVIRIITPGTVLSDQLLEQQSNNFILALCQENGSWGCAACDVSTGEFLWSDYRSEELAGLLDQLYLLMPAEILIIGNPAALTELQAYCQQRIPRCLLSYTSVDPDDQALQLLQDQFGPNDLPNSPPVLLATGVLLRYLRDTIKTDLTHINRLEHQDRGNHLILDANTLRNLEVIRNLRDGGKNGTLFSVLDFTHTAMGGRMLKRWIEAPLLSPALIARRQDGIAALLARSSVMDRLAAQLGDCYDLERLASRIETGAANPRDLAALRVSLAILPVLKDTLAEVSAEPALQELGQQISVHQEVYHLLLTALEEQLPLNVRDGGIIKPGYDLELDELLSIARDSHEWVQRFEQEEKERTGIRSLKVGFNRVFGYYIEVTHSNREAVPDSYIRKQTLTNAERYITPELKNFEEKILSAQEKISQLEQQIYQQIITFLRQHLHDILGTARGLGALDALISLAEAARRHRYVRPELHTRGEILIQDGRHPVIENLLVTERFVPNDTLLNHQGNELLIITGPNMAGKSTYMRQVALIVLMAHIGSYVPARQAAISLVDRIFTRIGASDDLAAGHSTFMVEMTEVSQILRHATAKSLIILDEVGRGTSTYDGMSIARAVVEYIYDNIKAKTLFATHYHELTALAEEFSRIRNYTVAVKEKGNEVQFLHRIVAGGADKSYGIHVAQLAGLPRKVTQHAARILKELEAGGGTQRLPMPEPAAVQCDTLFQSAVKEDLLALDVMTMTPLEAINHLFRLQQMAKQESGLP